MNVLILGPEFYKNAFMNFSPVEFRYEKVGSEEDIKWADLVCFTGGEDVDPSGYGEAAHPSTRFNTERDLSEAEVFHAARVAGKPIVGICRGAQFVTVMNGGSLIQNVTNHAITDTHLITATLPDLKAGKDNYYRLTFPVTSTHHQMMYPYTVPNCNYKLIGWSVGLSSVFEGIPDRERELRAYTEQSGRPRDKVIEPEVIYFPGSNSLAVQYHPEQMPRNSKAVDYFQSAINLYLFNREA